MSIGAEKLRRRFEKAACILPFLMGLVPTRERQFNLRDRRIRWLKYQSLNLYPENHNKAVFIMEKAQKEENFLNFDKRCAAIEVWLKSKPTSTVVTNTSKPHRIAPRRKWLTQEEVDSIISYKKAELEIVEKLGLKKVAEDNELLEKLGDKKIKWYHKR